MEPTMIELVNRALTGDMDAQTKLYMLTKNKAYYIALQLLKNPQDAEDVLQDSYIAAIAKLSTLDNGNKFQGWFDTIVINKAKDVLKKKKSIVFTDMYSADGDEYVPDKVEDRIEFMPQENLDYQETKRLVQEIIDGLSEEQRIAVMLYYYKEMSVAEVAAYSECSVNTIKSRLNYARKTIKSKVEELSKKGTKLYCVPILPFLYWLFRTEAAETVCTSTKILQQLQATSSSNMIAEEVILPSSDNTVKTSTNSILKDSSENGIKGIAAKVGSLSLGMKIGIIAVLATIGIVGGITLYQTLIPQTKVEESALVSQTKDEENILISQTKDEKNISADNSTEEPAVNKENDKFSMRNEKKEDNSEPEEKSIDETNNEAKNEQVVPTNNAPTQKESTDENLKSVVTNSDDVSPEPVLAAGSEKISENESNSEAEEIDANYMKLIGYGYKGNLWINNISIMKEEDSYYLLTADVSAPVYISEDDYEDVSNGLVTSVTLAGINYDIKPITESDYGWDYGDYKLVNGDLEYFIDNTDEQADGDIDDYYETTFGINFISPKGCYYIKDIVNHQLLYKLLESKITLKVSKEADIEMLDGDEYSGYSIDDCINSAATGQHGQTFEESRGQIVFNERGMILNFYEDHYE